MTTVQENFCKLFSALTLYRHNMKVLHWKCVGLDFDSTHELMENYANILTSMHDEIAEIMISVGINPLSLGESLGVLDDDKSTQYISIDPKLNYTSQLCFQWVEDMFNSLKTLYAKFYEGGQNVPSDIISVMDDHLKTLRIEHQYKNKMRLSTN